MWEKPVHCLQKVIYCSPVSLPILARLRGEELLPTPCKHLLIWRWTKAKQEVLEQFLPTKWQLNLCNNENRTALIKAIHCQEEE